jgi:hypothetical protein
MHIRRYGSVSDDMESSHKSFACMKRSMQDDMNGPYSLT